MSPVTQLLLQPEFSNKLHTQKIVKQGIEPKKKHPAMNGGALAQGSAREAYWPFSAIPPSQMKNCP